LSLRPFRGSHHACIGENKGTVRNIGRGNGLAGRRIIGVDGEAGGTGLRIDCDGDGSGGAGRVRGVAAIARSYGICAAGEAVVVGRARAIGEGKKEVVVCGEIASDPLMAQILVGLGYRNLSINIHRMTAVGDALAAYTRKELAEQAGNLLSLPTLQHVLDLFARR